MALVFPAKSALWKAIRCLQKRDYIGCRKNIEDALVYLELSPAMLDPGLKTK